MATRVRPMLTNSGAAAPHRSFSYKGSLPAEGRIFIIPAVGWVQPLHGPLLPRLSGLAAASRRLHMVRESAIRGLAYSSSLLRER